MRRRLSVAMACIGSPDILILDEPTTGLDPASHRQVWEVIEKVKDGRSVILTTHAIKKLIICVHVLVNKESDIVIVLFVFYLRYNELWVSTMSWFSDSSEDQVW